MPAKRATRTLRDVTHRHVSAPGLRPRDVAAYAASYTGPQGTWMTIGGPDVTVLPVHLLPVLRGQADLERARAEGAVYGLTTGVGALRHVPVPDGVGTGERALRLWRSHAAGIGPELDDGLAGATMLVRLHQLLQGGSGAGPSLVEALAAAVASGAVPRLHRWGGIGTGDLTVLSELALTLVGELPWRSGSAPVADIADGDALPFISSNAMTIALGSLAVTRLGRLARAAEQVAALSHLALRGSVQAYDARVHAAKDDPAASGVAARLSALLDADARPSARVQDPFGLRAIPQVHSPLEEALEIAERALTAEIGASTENPLAVQGRALHHGQFVTQRLAATLDAARAAVAPAMTLSVARLSALLDPTLSGLRPFLAEGPPASSGLMIMEYVASDLMAQVRTATAPVTSVRTVVSLGLEEHASHSTQAAWAVQDLVDLIPDLLACELVAAVRALRFDPERLVDCPARELFDIAAAHLPDVRPDHILGPELTAAAEIVRALA